jgi:hypothetical protein
MRHGTAEWTAETYTDEQVTTACGLHLDNLRRLITWGAVTPVQSGGGRGRIRKWTARQALRIGITAQFVEAGFSLKMAHTLTYCLPLNDLLYAYDPDVIRTRLGRKRDRESKRRRATISRTEENYWPGRHSLGSHVFIVDHQLLYGDVLARHYMLFAVIDSNCQRVAPAFNPYQYYHGVGIADEFNLPKILDVKRIARSSLLIEDKFIGAEKPSLDLLKQHIIEFRNHIPAGVAQMIQRPERLVCKNLCIINLAVGLTSILRSLLGLPVRYFPFEDE